MQILEQEMGSASNCPPAFITTKFDLLVMANDRNSCLMHVNFEYGKAQQNASCK